MPIPPTQELRDDHPSLQQEKSLDGDTATNGYIDISTIGLSKVEEMPASLPRKDATTSYWMATSSDLDALSASSTSHQTPLPSKTDVAIIGSGITGVSCALQLAHSLPPGSNVILLEARSFCSGATGRNGGHLTAVSALAYSELAANPSHLLRHVSVDRISESSTRAQAIGKCVGQILSFEANTAASIRDIIQSNGAVEEVGLTTANNWHLCFQPEEVEAFEDSLRAAQEAGLEERVSQVRRVPMTEVNEIMEHPEGIVAVYEIPGATLHPRRLVSLLLRLAQSKAVERDISLQIFTETPVSDAPSPSPAAESIELKTSRGPVRARHVVHATNGYASHLLPSLAGPKGIVPTRAQVVAVAPRQSKTYWGVGISSGGGYEYGHQRPSGLKNEPSPLFIFGGGREYAPTREWGVDDDSTLCPEVSAFLHPWLHTVFPSEYGKDVKQEWSGIMGYTASKDPMVGPVANAPNQWIAAGYSGHGMTRAFSCGRLVADMITAKEKDEVWKCPDSFPSCYLTQSTHCEI
ncbi:DAO-domain-containing protein [Testicularia cyperi]|uniref:DAO-domain-containing protein n=1 Tax=Testicularia cyperi TaxID=1882483 RepID=A0A317XP88_9BASI|nr:DAO-domain-containing protein [Testicularia cyperi]